MHYQSLTHSSKDTLFVFVQRAVSLKTYALGFNGAATKSIRNSDFVLFESALGNALRVLVSSIGNDCHHST